METKKVCCCDDIFGYAKVSAIVELCLSVIVNIGLLVGLIFAAHPNQSDAMGQPGIFNFILISTNTILVILELNTQYMTNSTLVPPVKMEYG
jgi:hypothetical protein